MYMVFAWDGINCLPLTGKGGEIGGGRYFAGRGL
jgi:hypothetical protein